MSTIVTTAAESPKAIGLGYSVVVPVYNEHEMIGEFCARAVAELPPGYELLIVYDMDEDTTLPALQALAPTQKPRNIRLVKNDLGRGVRYAIDAGMRAAQAPVVVVMMADLSDDFSKVEEMVQRCQAGADVVCASRYMKGGKQIGGPMLKGLLSRAAGLTLNWFTGLPTHDPTNSFKAYRRDFLNKTPIESTAGFTLGMELTVKAHFNGSRVEEIPATWRDREAGQSRFQLKKWLPLYLRWYSWAFQRRLIGSTPADFAWTGAYVLLFLIALCLFIPWKTALPGPELDSSWYMVLPWAWKHHLAFGRDIAFTYGPWGFALQGYEPTTFKYVVGTWTAFTLLFCIVVVRLANQIDRRRWVGFVWAILTLGIVSADITGLHDSRVFAMCWGLVVLHFFLDDGPATPLKIALVLAMALASLGKFSTALAAATAIGLISADQILRRQFPRLLVIYVVAVLALWMAASQSLRDLPAFIGSSLRITAGYAEGEGISPPTEIRDVTLYGVICVFFLMVVALAHVIQIARARAKDATIPPTYDGKFFRPNERAAISKAVPSLLALLFALMLNVKVGYIRHDQHEPVGTICVAVLGLMYGAALWRLSGAWLMRSLIALMVASSISLAWQSESRWLEHSLPGYFVQEMKSLPARAGTAVGWVFGSTALQHEYEQQLEAYRPLRPLPALKGTVDVYSFGQHAVLAQGLQYHPRPVFQSYLAYTSALAQMNADFLRSDRAPDWILFDMQAIDTHYPSLEDGASWPEIISRYEPRANAKAHFILQKSAKPETYKLAELQTITAPLDYWVNLPQPQSTNPARGPQTQPQPTPPPQPEMIWAKIELKPKMPGRLLSLLYKPDPVVMQVRTAGGWTSQFRLLPDLAKGGFLLSPFIGDRMSFVLLGSDRWQSQLRDQVVTQILVTGGPDASFGAFFEPNYSITFYRLALPHRDLSSVAGLDEYVRFHELISQSTPILGNVQFVRIEDDPSALLMPGPARLLLPPRPNARTLELQYGLLWQGVGPLEQLDAVDYRVYAMNQNENQEFKGVIIWQKTLDPAKNPEDRAVHRDQIAIPEPHPARLLLEVVPRSTHLPSYPYWAGVDLR